MPKKIDKRVLPDMECPQWSSWVGPLIVYLKESNSVTWSDLFIWAKKSKVAEFKLKNCLAWLDCKNLVKWDKSKNVWFLR